jgi:hypothetical protein
MKNLKLLLFIAIIIVSFSSCSGGYGKEYKLDSKHNIYYKGEGVDEALAKKLALYLKKQEYFQDSITASVQLEKIKDTFNLSFVVDKSKITPEFDNTFLIFGAFIAEQVFNNAPVTIQLTNNKLEPFKNLGYAKPLSDTLK